LNDLPLSSTYRFIASQALLIELNLSPCYILGVLMQKAFCKDLCVGE
jgi:hypothetical protein